MGILNLIREKKEAFQNATVQRRKQVLMRRTEKIQADNIRQAELTEARQKLSEAQQINADLRGASPVPSRLQKFGSGVKNALEKHKANKKVQSIAEKVAGGQKQTMKVAMPVSSGSQGGTGGSQGSIFGGQRNIEVGQSKGSPFNTGGKGLKFGR